jgi:hypothetical protein
MYMDAMTVYMKTSQGHDEITTRAHRLPARMRTVLITVDGRRTAAELIAQNPTSQDTDRHLAALLEGGFISAAPQQLPSDDA